ncbi:hypothetical protein ACQEVS_11745 [Streptomyces sp. CA-181903]|uniref:hypothetical protein n=1 Tax=Streptomyces sp. CA-181903 TaxID=3240055 RepID=UPI003D8BBDC9
MTYNFLTADRLHPEAIRQALSTCFAVETSSVDVADAESDQDRRNWDALVLCDFSGINGQLSLSLDIYVQESVISQPTEAEAALRFAAATRTVVLYPAEENIPSAYWAITPDMKTTRVRLSTTDDERPAYSIDAAESEIPQFPDAHVTLLPEVIREHPVAIPATESFLAKAEAVLSPDKREDATQPEKNDADNLSDRARNSLAAWERMTRRMATGWPPSGGYPFDMYMNDLRARDDLAAILAKYPEPVHHFLLESVHLVDSEFKRLTEPDRDHVIKRLTGAPQGDVTESDWWWYRKPIALPWSRQ